MKCALKEWNSTIEALGSGQVIAVWEKSQCEQFKVNQKQFILFPTTLHQNQDKIKETYWGLLNGNPGPNRDNQIKVKYWSEVEEEFEVDTMEQLFNLSCELINSPEYLVSSWNLHPECKGKILILRVYKLANPILIPYSNEYSGHESWIDLKIDIPKIGSKPVLSFKEFSQKVRLIHSLLQQQVILEKVVA